MAVLRRWQISKQWKPYRSRNLLYLDFGNRSVCNTIADCDDRAQTCLAKSVRLLVEIDDIRRVSSYHFKEVREGLYEVRCEVTRLYWCRHPALENSIVLLLLVPNGKTKQSADINEALRLKEIACQITEITEN